MENRYFTDNMLTEHFKSLSDKIDYNTSLTKDLNTKVGIQNGRVAKLEGKWNSVVLATTVVIVLFGAIVSLVVYSFNLSLQNTKQQILLDLKK